MVQPIYQTCDLEHWYGDYPALKLDTLSIRPASIVGLMGPNGSGKSTLLKILAFVQTPSRGKVLFRGRPAEPYSDAVRFQVTLLTQKPYLMKRSVFDNVAYGLKIRGIRTDYAKRISQALAMVGLPAEEFAGRQWYELSGGEAQRVALAARLVLRPEALLLDEPTASVDASSAQLIKDASIWARQEWGTTLVIASHDLQWLYDICDETLHLFRGRVFGTGMVNIVSGPWQPRPDGRWEKTLQEGQRIVVPRPPAINAPAIVDPAALSLRVGKDDHQMHDNTLRGVISRLILEKSTKDIVATISVLNLTFTLKLNRQRLEELRLYPGQTIFLCFDSDAVKWY